MVFALRNSVLRAFDSLVACVEGHGALESRAERRHDLVYRDFFGKFPWCFRDSLYIRFFQKRKAGLLTGFRAYSIAVTRLHGMEQSRVQLPVGPYKIKNVLRQAQGVFE